MAFATADLCDEFGAEVQVAEPLFRDWGGSRCFAGPIESLRVFEDNALVRQALEEPGLGRVLVVDGGGSLRTALVGGSLAALAYRNGWTGVVSVVLRREHGSTLEAVIQRRATAEEAKSEHESVSAAALRAAVHSAVRRVPETVRASER